MNILDALGSWSMHSGPLYRRLATAIKNSIVIGEIPPGTALPAERHLAKALVLGRSTVVAAYDLLREEGILESKQGSGTWVAGAARNVAQGNAPQESLRGAALAGNDNIVDLATASLPAAPIVREAIGAIQGELLEQVLTSSGYSALGLLELRRAVAEMFTEDGVPTTPDQVLITTGDQQALFLICGQLLNLGDTAIVEDPTSPGILDLLNESPTAVRSAPSLASAGAHGLLEVISKASPELVYLLPALGPSGQVTDEAEIREFAAGLRNFSGTVIEDASARFLVAEKRPPLISGIAPNANILTVGSMSKVFWGGLRVGWVRGEENVIQRLSRAKARSDLGTPLLSQLISAWLLRRIDRVSQARIADIEARQESAAEVIRARLPEFEFEKSSGGLTTWLRMPRGASRPFSELARRNGVAIVPGAALSASGMSDRYLRVALGKDSATFADGIERLATAWNEFDQSVGAHKTLTEGSTLV